MGFPKPRLRRKALVGIAGTCLLLVIIVVWFVPPPRVKVVASDPRFHLLSARLLTSTNESFYLGNPIEGRVRDFLRFRCHLKVKLVPNVTPLAFSLGMRRAPQREVAHPSWFALHFTLDESPLNSYPISVELWDPAGNKVLSSASVWSGKPLYWQVLDLDADRFLPGNYRVRLVQAGACLAEFELRDLPRVRHTAL